VVKDIAVILDYYDGSLSYEKRMKGSEIVVFNIKKKTLIIDKPIFESMNYFAEYSSGQINNLLKNLHKTNTKKSFIICLRIVFKKDCLLNLNMSLKELIHFYPKFIIPQYRIRIIDAITYV
jgi:hypothetical protein